MKKLIIVVFVAIVSIVSYLNSKEEKNSNAVATVKIPLTINNTLQNKVKALTIEMKKQFQAKSISVAAIDSKTGKILVLVNSNTDTIKEFPNNSIANFSYEPGSVFKPIVFSIALEENITTPDTIVNGHKGKYKINGKIVTDEYKFQYLAASDVIVHSSNVGMAQIAQNLSLDPYYDGLISFGFMQHATKDFKNEALGLLPPKEKLSNGIYKATTSYGYGVKANLLQLLKAYNVFNNCGNIIDLSIVADKPCCIQPKKVLSDKTLKEMRKILIDVVKRGTGKNAKIDGVEIGGKTGTAHIVENGKYVDKYNTSFIGFANKGAKRYTIAVLVQQPKKNFYASQSAAVVFRKVVGILIKANKK